MFGVFLISCKATAKIILIIGAGAYLEWVGIFNTTTRKFVSVMAVKLLLPCLLFTKVMYTMSADNLPIWLWLSAANVTYVMLGFVVGSLGVLVTGPPRGMRKVFAAVPAVGHGNSIPLMLGAIICTPEQGFLETDAAKAEGYVGLYLVMHSITMWGVGMSVLKPDPTGDDDAGAVAGGGPAPAALGRAQEPQRGEQDDTISEAERGDAWTASVATLEIDVPAPEQRRARLLCTPAAVRGVVPKWVNRPMVAAVLGMLCGLSPTIKGLMVTTNSPLNFLYSAMESIGRAGPPLLLMGVGGIFVSEGKPTLAGIGAAPMAGLLVGRLVVLPTVAIGFWMFCREYLGFFPADPIVLLIMCIESCTPSAYNLVTMCVLQGRGAREMSVVLFYQNVVAVVTMTFWITLILGFVVTERPGWDQPQ